MAESRRVVITGFGLVSPIGNDPESFWNALQAGTSGVGKLQRVPGDSLTTQVGAEALDFDGGIDDFGELSKDQKRSIKRNKKVMCREIEMGVAVAQKCMNHAGILVGEHDPDTSGVIYGCDYIMTEPVEYYDSVKKCIGDDQQFDYEKWGETGLPNVTPLWLLKYLPNMPASHIAIYNDFRGPNNSITLREASANLAFGEAFCTITRSYANTLIAGATGTRIHPLRSVHVSLQEPLANDTENPARSSRPFDRDRGGQVIGEGSGAIMLEELEHAKNRNAQILGEIVGYGSSTVRSAQGVADFKTAISNSIRGALRTSKMTPGDIGHINAHGLSSIECDASEAQAIHDVLDSDGKKTPVFAPKSYFGNLGAGGGAVELIASVMCLNQGHLVPTLNYENADPECPVRVVTDDSTAAGDSFLNINVTPFGQASAVIVRKFAD